MADGEIVPHLDDKDPSSSLCCLQLYEQFLANAGNNLLILPFKVLYDSWVIVVDSFFNSPTKRNQVK